MQRVSLICVGKLKEKFYIDATAEYRKRLQRHCKFDLIELPEVRLGDNPSPAEIHRALAAEAAAIREKIDDRAAVVAMCVEGKPCNSPGLSEKLQSFALNGRSHVVFLIGGSFGLDEGLKKEADWRLSMSPMTFPHHLARVMLLEQIYRAYQIAEGTAYHK
ncbi:MAG: 23S rRNA (pseudouridine(1915)-N(3))-methyltransferase RlmH [Oscillospiraceae bacterium]|nr:23S rRNA (pseudouridine(1915)-N(3))-methyltransferase RlmH [Oscillospiraceae bacterium]